MKLLLVLAAVIGLAICQTTLPPEHNCFVDHEAVLDDPHKYRVSDLEGNWEEKTCNPPHLVFVMQERCFCGWSDPTLTYGNCSDVNRPSQASPDLDYMYEFWHPVLNIWAEKNCHDTFPANFAHNNEFLFFNETGCSCDWKPGHPIYAGPPATEDCTLDMDIVMNSQPPVDSMGSFVQPYDPIWKVWPPTVLIAPQDNRNALRCMDSRLKSWFLQGNEKKDIWFYFGLQSTSDDDPTNFRVVLADSCASIITGDTRVFPAKFVFEYRANPSAFRILYNGGEWVCNSGGNRVGNWVDLVINYQARAGFNLYVNGEMCELNENTPEDEVLPPANPFFRLSNNCELNICGDPLNVDTKYTGFISTFQEKSGAACAVAAPEDLVIPV